MTTVGKLALQATHGMSFMLKSMPVPAIIHVGGLVFLWKGNDNGRTPTHWNLHVNREQSVFCVAVVSQ